MIHFRVLSPEYGDAIASQADLGMRVLMWLHFAYRPLKLVELQHALAVKKSHIEFGAGNIKCF